MWTFIVYFDLFVSNAYPIEQRGRFVVEIEGRFEVVLEQQRSRM